jgi:methenyltetrahydrofolate cyclohydrolase
MHDVTIDGWLRTLADRTPTPGGGAVAALAAASAAALIGMVTRYTQGKKWADREARMQELGVAADGWRELALALGRQDEAAFAAVGAAFAMPRSDEGEKEARRAAIQAALIGATDPPIRIAQLASLIVDAAEELITTGNPNVLSDVGVASAMAEAALSSAALNIAINVAGLPEGDLRDGPSRTLFTAAHDAERARDVTRRVLAAVGP